MLHGFKTAYNSSFLVRCSHAADAQLSPRQRRIAEKQRRWREDQQKLVKKHQKVDSDDQPDLQGEKNLCHGDFSGQPRHDFRDCVAMEPSAPSSAPQQIFAHHPGLFSDLTIEGLVDELGSSLRYDTILLEGKEVQESRATAWLSDNGATFKYSGKEMEGGPLTPTIRRVRDQLALNQHLYKIHYDSCLVNFYPNGKSGMRFHSDPLYATWVDQTAVVSIGQTRKFIFRKIDDFSKRTEFLVTNGDVIFMGE